MFRPLDRCGRDDHDHLADRLSPEVGAEIKGRVFPRVIPIGKTVVVTARSWSLDDSAAGMDGARLTYRVRSGDETTRALPSDQDGRVVLLFTFPHPFFFFLCLVL
jgi:hypothetical protein